MEMWIWQLCENEINFFEKKADEILVETMIHETKMERRKQQQLEPTKEDIDELVRLITKMLKTIAIIETYRYFQMLQILPTQNIPLFYSKKDEHFENLLMVFVLKIKNEQEIDFTVSEC